jgi:hypothetical protein
LSRSCELFREIGAVLEVRTVEELIARLSAAV